MDIILNQGVGNINFSMNLQDIESILGTVQSIDDFINDKITYYYDKIGLAINYSLLNGKSIISSIEVEDSRYQLWSEPLYKRSYDEIIDFLQKNEVCVTDYKIDTWYSTTYIFYKNLCIEFEKDIVSVVTLYNPELE